jgi:DNA polymerase III subunit delta'
MSELSPRSNTQLYGHAEAESQLLRDYASGKLAHGWLLSGPRGIGKATLAYRFARTLLTGEAPEEIHAEHPVFRRMVAGSHADMLVIEPKYDEKKEEDAREITVEQAREIGQFMAYTPGEGQWRVVIIDSIDALNPNAANAILKILEEPPPQSVILLISHNPGRLLPTIRSRCRSLRLAPLNRDAFIPAMRICAPGIDNTELIALAQLSQMSPGIALELHEASAYELYREILALLATPTALDSKALHGFAETLGTGKVHSNWRLFTHMMLCLLERTANVASAAAVDFISREEESTLRALSALHPAYVWAEKWQQVAEYFLLAERLHLDYKQLILTFFHSLPMRDGFHIGSAAA